MRLSSLLYLTVKFFMESVTVDGTLCVRVCMCACVCVYVCVCVLTRRSCAEMTIAKFKE